MTADASNRWKQAAWYAAVAVAALVVWRLVERLIDAARSHRAARRSR